MVIFTDFDGVTHPWAVSGHQEWQLFSCRHVLWRILKAAPQTEVVISSTWRRNHRFEELVQSVTEGGGEHLRDRFVGANPEIPRNELSDPYRLREQECEAWLYGNGQPWRPWVALDDVPSGFSAFQPRLIVTNPATGLVDSDIPRVLEAIRKLDRLIP